uniref:Ran-binding protein 16 (inferred by orthology to a D. melanogaster protein) n=1 Tax=Nippostrongylus brasiliensis TaxID=27835 RepID=A0A0N4YFH9_NIPBR
MDELEVLNRLCKELGESMDPATRARAEQNLAELVDSPQCLRRCMLLLERGDLPYGPVVASNTLMKLLNSKMGILVEQKLELSRYILNLLGSRSSSLPPFIVSSLCQLFARITKQEWTYTDSNDQHVFHAPISDLLATIDPNGGSQSMLALQLLSTLLTDFNSQAGMESVNKHRKGIALFRDSHIFEIFETSVSLLEAISRKDDASLQMPFVLAVLDLCLNTLLFDFIGSLSDETSEDNYTVQVPTIWRTAFTDGKLVDLIFQLYIKLPSVASEKILHIGVQLTSVRRTLFNGSERQTYLEHVVAGVKRVIEHPEKLTEQPAFHEFCRMVSRLKTNFQLCELIKVPDYTAVMRLLAQFTVESLRMMDLSANSTYFLLMFWQRMVTSVPYVRSSEDHLLNLCCPEIMTAFVESRLQNVERGSTLQIMEHLAIICRCEYEKTAQLLASAFDENARIMEAGPEGDIRVLIAEGRLVWLVTLIGTAVFGKTAVSNNEEHDKMDGDLVARCLKFMRINDNRLIFPTSVNANPGKGNVRLEVAFIHLLEQFRRAYIMDQITKSSPVYDKLNTELGVSDETDMLSVIVQKILTNLKYWATNDQILELSLALLKDLSLGYTAVRKLFRLQEVQLLLSNHTAEHFVFLGQSVPYSTMKHRTVFYEALTRLLTIDLNDDEQLFEQFMQPLAATSRELTAIMTTQNYTGAVTQEELKRVVVGLCRDLRGVAVARDVDEISTFQTYFADLYRFNDLSCVMTPIFRLLAELCQNRQQRLKFEMSSCSAVLLFKEASKIICAYGERLLVMPDAPKERAYAERYKNIGIIFNVLKCALIGAYVPFGVFRLYGDPCLQDSLNMFVKLFMKIPEEEFHSYTKIAQHYYNLLENVVQDNIAFVSNLQPEIFAAILRSVHTGVTSLDAVVITSACSALDTILNYLYKRFTRSPHPVAKVGMEPEGDSCLVAVKTQPQLMSDVSMILRGKTEVSLQILTSMMTSLMFGEVKCQWSISRPLLGLILLQEEVFTNFKREIISQQPEERHAAFDQAFLGLMDGVEMSLTVKNKDIFTQNLAKFRREIVEAVKGKEVSPSASNNEMC